MNIVLRDADASMKAHKYQAAVTDYDTYLTRKPEENDVRLKLGQAQMAAGDARNAAANLAIALDVAPLDDRIVEAYAQALYETGDRDKLTEFVNRYASERGRPQDYLRVARYMQRIGHPDEAQQALKTAAKLDGGKTFEMQMALADFYKSVGDKQRQVRRLRMAYFLKPEDADLNKAIRAAGEVPGPTFALAPEEFAVPTIASPQGGVEMR